MRVLAFHQPNFLPNLSFFHKMRHCDVFVVVTRIPYTRRDWQNRVKVSDGTNEQMLTVPVPGSNRQLICDARLDPDRRWRRKLVRTLDHLYGKTAERGLVEAVTKVIDGPDERLVDLNWKLIGLLKEVLGVETETFLDEETSGQRAEIVVGLAKRYGADCYLSGQGGRHYMDEAYLKEPAEAGVQCRFVEKSIVPDYPCSALHYILRDGVDAARAVVNT